ncbi:MAG: PGPGW domain-containing protein [Actinomycetota bacterium]|nr:PGPGW domain-containing protein [Actinomycetota bacterium]
MDLHSPRELLRVVFRNSKRIAVLLLGVVLVVAGLAMLVLPGPGLLVVIAGLVVLATEFAWAEHLLDRARQQAAKAKERAGGMWRRRHG